MIPRTEKIGGYFFRRAKFLLVAVAGMVLLVGPAQADSLIGATYSVALTPTDVPAGVAQTYAVTIENTSDSDVDPVPLLGAADVTMPGSFRNVSVAIVTASNPSKTWSVTNDSGKLQFRAGTPLDALNPGESVSADVTATSPCTAGAYTVSTSARMVDGLPADALNDFVNEGNDPEITVASTPASMAFRQQPTDTGIGRKINPAVTVEVRDACNNSVTGASVDIALKDNPTGATLSGTKTRTVDAQTGVASFDDLTLDKRGTGYTLVASSGGVSVTSDSFEVFDFYCEQFPCEGADPGKTTQVSVTSSGQLSEGAALGINFSAPGIRFGDSSCGALKSTGSVVTLVPQGNYGGLIESSFTYSKSVAPGTGVANFRFCANDNDGEGWYEVFNCAKDAVVPPKCISKRNRTGVGDLVVKALMTWTDPDWGGF